MLLKKKQWNNNKKGDELNYLNYSNKNVQKNKSSGVPLYQMLKLHSCNPENITTTFLTRFLFSAAIFFFSCSMFRTLHIWSRHKQKKNTSSPGHVLPDLWSHGLPPGCRSCCSIGRQQAGSYQQDQKTDTWDQSDATRTTHRLQPCLQHQRACWVSVLCGSGCLGWIW